MAEFKKLSEVDVLETASDNATVLIEESGEIKRVPKKEVGGAGGGYIIKLSESYLDDNGHYCIESNYDEIYDVLVAGGSVWVDFTDRPQMAPSIAAASGLYAATNWSEMTSLIVCWELTDVGLALYEWDGATIYFPNGSHNLEPMDYGDR